MGRSLTDEGFLEALFVEKGEELASRSELARVLFGPEPPLGLANLLVGADGNVDPEGVKQATSLLQAGLYSLGPGGHLYAQGRFHLLKILSNPPLLQQLQRLRPPHSNPLADHLIRRTLELAEGRLVGIAEVRRAVFVALLTPLRQNIGSCFATAPAILIQSEAPQRLLSDLEELLERGSLGRVVGGVEYRVPLCPTGGDGVCALLKAWEFTLASFAEAKNSFSKWNLYASLGLHPEEEGGIGEQVHQFLEEKLAEANRELDEMQVRYDAAFSHGKYLEARLARAPEEEAKWLQLEFRRRVGELDQISAQREALHETGRRIANLIPTLIEAYSHLFPTYFQEVYDPSIREVGLGSYDDARAGFRLLYKHGRAVPGAWTWIDGADTFITCLSDFFILSEGVLRDEESFEGLEKLLSELVGVVVRHIREEGFLESALVRMAAAHKAPLPKDPLQHLDQVEKKPWAYLSGGTMRELVAGYLGTETLPKMRERRVESPDDLLIFLLDGMKELPPKLTDGYLQDPMRSMLIQSPTHAFLFKPGLSPLREGWLDRGNTSTWIREQVVGPAEEFLSTLWLDKPAVEALVALLERRLPPPFRPALRDLIGQLGRGRMRPAAFRERLISGIANDQSLRQIAELASGEWIDSLLYTSLPFCLAGELKERLSAIFGKRPKGLDHYNPTRGAPLLSARQFHKVCLACAIIEGGGAYSGDDLPWQIRSLAHQKGYAMPLPLLFADTNWKGQLFGLIVNPGTSHLSLWRTDYLGLEAVPMVEWQSSLDGTSPHPWGIFVDTNSSFRE